eukprot:SAG11_NODE_3811_length_2212_cov_0.942735_2_plen_190_part_00
MLNPRMMPTSSFLVACVLVALRLPHACAGPLPTRRLQATIPGFAAARDGALSGHNLHQGQHSYSTQPSAEACSVICIEYSSECLSFDFSEGTHRCYLGDAREGDDASCTLAQSSSNYHYFERLDENAVAQSSQANPMDAFDAPLDGSLSGNNIPVSGHQYTTQADPVSCAGMMKVLYRYVAMKPAKSVH